MQSEWEKDLQALSAQCGIETPKLVVKEKWYRPLWPLTSYSSRPGAWGAFKWVIVSKELLDWPAHVRRYVLAHELGHVARKHHRPFGMSIFFLCGLLALVDFGPYVHLPVPVLVFSFFTALFIAFPMVLVVRCSLLFEYDADKVACELVGKDEVIRGIRETGSLLNDSASPARAKRIRRLHAGD
jgi:Zn-dependent protease with chaperone function